MPRRVFILCFGNPESHSRTVNAARAANNLGYTPHAIGLIQKGVGPPRHKHSPFEKANLTTFTGSMPQSRWRAQTILCGLFAKILPLPKVKRFASIHLPYCSQANALASSKLGANEPNPNDIIYVSHWQLAPAAIKASKRFGCSLIYDLAEFSVVEFQTSFWWRSLVAPLAKSCETDLIANAHIVTTASQKMDSYLESNYARVPSTAFVANAGLDAQTKGAPVTRRRNNRFVYFGGIRNGRGLEEAISALPLISKEADLSVYGYGKVAYVVSLKNLAKRLNVMDRLHFYPAIPADQAIETLSDFSVGLAAFNPTDKQLSQAQPNKVFYYLAARLKIVVSAGTLLEKQLGQTTFVAIASSYSSTAMAEAMKAANNATEPSVNALGEYLQKINAVPLEDVLSACKSQN